MSAYDTAYPSRTTVKDFQVGVVRNANSPHFVKENYEQTITEKFPIGDNILQVSATDADRVSSLGVCIEFKDVRFNKRVSSLRCLSVECGSSVVECRIRHRMSQGSNMSELCIRA